MARVSQSAALKSQIDRMLDYLFKEWSEVPEVAKLWDIEFDSIDKEVYELERTIPRERFERLKCLAEEGLLSPEQRIRYDELLSLMEKTRPFLTRMGVLDQ